MSRWAGRALLALWRWIHFRRGFMRKKCPYCSILLWDFSDTIVRHMVEFHQDICVEQLRHGMGVWPQ